MSKILIIDGNLFARKMFYRFHKLSSKVKVSDLFIFSKKFQEQISAKEENSTIEILDKKTGKKIFISKDHSRIDKKIKSLTENKKEIKLNTGVTFGVMRSLIASVRNYNIGKIIICYDPFNRNRKEQLRSKMFKGYKASREEDSRRKIEETIEFYKQLSITHYLLYYMGIKQVWSKSFEADDLLHYYSKKVFKNKKSLLLTNDHDLFQTIDNKNSILLIGTNNSIFGRKEFFEKFGIDPSQYLDVMSLCGCSSDEVPGLSGIGEVKAISLIKIFKTLKNLKKSFVKRKDEIEPDLYKILKKEKQLGFRTIKKTRKLVKLYGLNSKLKEEMLIKKKVYSINNFKRVVAILKVLKFRSLLNKEELKTIGTIMKNQS